MSTRLRHKGKFVKEHIVAAKAKRVAALQAASRKRAQNARESLVAEQPESFQERYRIEGRRIFDMCRNLLKIWSVICAKEDSI